MVYPHIFDDGVSAMSRYKVLHFARLRYAEMRATDEMAREIVLGSGGIWRPIGGTALAWFLRSCHCVCGNSHARVVVWRSVEGA